MYLITKSKIYLSLFFYFSLYIFHQIHNLSYHLFIIEKKIHKIIKITEYKKIRHS